MTNRKSHTPFRLVPKSTTLDDLERPICTLAEKMRLSAPTTKIWIMIDPHYQWQNCSLVTVLSGDIRLMRIFAGVPWGGASNDSGVPEVVNGNFQRFRWLFYGYFGDTASVIIWRYPVRRRLFGDPKCVGSPNLEWSFNLEWLFRVKLCFRAGLADWDGATFE